MELDELLRKLLDSGMTDNQHLAVTLLDSENVADEDKIKYLDEFVKNYHKEKDAGVLDEDRKKLFDSWMELYGKFTRVYIKNRVKKIL